MNIVPDFTVLIQLIFFFMVYWAFDNLLIPPVLDVILRRRKMIEDAEWELKKKEEEGLEMEKAYQERLRDARLDAQEITKKYREEASEQEKSLLDAAQEKTNAFLEESHGKVQEMRKEALAKVEAESQQLSEHIVQSLLAKS